jgi:exodeoxyribonuclease III
MSATLKIRCWNINGIRAAWKKGLPDWIAKENPDIVCLQETKAQPDQLENEIKNFKDYKSYFFSAEKKGYSGVAVYSKQEPLKVTLGCNDATFDSEGRVIELDYKDFILFNVYFPNGGRGPERVKYKLEFYNVLFNRAQEARKRNKNVIVCGDYNTAHKEIDLARPKENAKTSGFLPEERAWIDKIIAMDYVDIFREFNQQPQQYSYWDQITRARDRNVGWRIDYYMISKEMQPIIKDATIHMDVLGSDHCPVGLEINI